MKTKKFALELEDGITVRDLEGLRENFSIIKLYEHYQSGKLQKWLEARYYDNELEQVNQLNFNLETFCQNICEIFNVDYSEKMEIEFKEDLEQLKKKDEELKTKKSKMESILKDTEVNPNLVTLETIDQIACSQVELERLLKAGKATVYLYGDVFEIDPECEGVEYVGINTPIVEINSKEVVDWGEKKIKLIDVTFDENYLAVLNQIGSAEDCCLKDYSKKRDTFLKDILSETQRKDAEKSYKRIRKVFNETGNDKNERNGGYNNVG